MSTSKIEKQTEKDVSSFKAERYELRGRPKATVHGRRDFYKIWLINNKGILRVSDQNILIERPALIFLNPLSPYVFEPIEKSRTGYWCIFTKEFLSDNFRTGLTGTSSLFQIDTPGIFFPDEQNTEVINFLFNQIIFDSHSSYEAKYDSIKDKIALLIHEGNKMHSFKSCVKTQNAATRIATAFLNLLEQQYPVTTCEIQVRLKKPGDFADELAVHVNHLNAVVKEITGKSTRDHIAGRMVSESKALLNFSDWSVADIAYSLGFDYPNHFNTFFKKHTGITPASLRK